MSAYLLVRAEVEENSREGFDNWYQNEHLPSALKEFEDSIGAWRAWSDVEDGIHLAFYEFGDLESARAVRAKCRKSMDHSRIYRESITPNYSVAIGDYRDRWEAELALAKYKKSYRDALIVPAEIALPDLD